MPDKKLTDNEIVKALRSWLEEIRKSRQAYLEKVNEEHYPSMRYEYLLSDTIHEINRLQADCENYKQIAEHQQSVTMDRGFEIKRLKEKIESLQAENERLQEMLQHLYTAVPIGNNKKFANELQKIKAEAYKEFAERLDKEIDIGVFNSCYIRNKINNLLKELVGEDNASK